MYTSPLFNSSDVQLHDQVVRKAPRVRFLRDCRLWNALLPTKRPLAAMSIHTERQHCAHLHDASLACCSRQRGLDLYTSFLFNSNDVQLHDRVVRKAPRVGFLRDCCLWNALLPTKRPLAAISIHTERQHCTHLHDANLARSARVTAKNLGSRSAGR